jgi:hypothetical protein
MWHLCELLPSASNLANSDTQPGLPLKDLAEPENKQNIVCIESVLTASQCLVQVIGELQRKHGNAARAGFVVLCAH